VTSIRAETLLTENQFRLQDYYAKIPGLSVAPMGFQSTQILSIRGINTGLAGNPSVGITVDDVPFGSSTNAGGGVTYLILIQAIWPGLKYCEDPRNAVRREQPRGLLKL